VQQSAAPMTRRSACRAATAVVFVGAAVAAWLAVRDGGPLAGWLEPARLLEAIHAMGAWGPFVVVLLMTTAILVSPLPSAPVALAAGAAYGHGWGTLYVVVGAELGAVCAFLLARYLGHEFVHRRFGARLSHGLAGSQRALMLTVLASRLLPFVSFDLVSYAAGLTVLRFWRFALATLAGIIPASFVLAHFGSEFATGGALSGGLAILVVGVLGVAPFVIRALHGERGQK